MDIFDLQAKISLNLDNFKKGIKTATENFTSFVKKTEETSQSIERMTVPLSKYKSDVMKLAAEYKKSGMEASEATKKAYADINKAYEEQGISVEKAAKKTGNANENIKKSQRSLADDSGKSSGTFSANWEKAAANMEKIADRIKSALSAAAKVSTAAVGAASTGIAAIVKNSVDSYANYEQLVGGVETLFKGSADKVQAYADAAYKTAGLSANEYMGTVTSFSASLIQSTGGDTEKAAELANQAIIDMSDNANKMGTSMDMIQNAYQGFAKQNYTMCLMSAA